RHRYLPSFPTRRSSDLASIRAAATPSRTARYTPTPPSGDIACAASPMHSKPSRCHLVSRFILISKHLTSSHVNSLSDCLVAGTRSEEHTSELQSRFDLV